MSIRHSYRRSGAALLEVLVALAILATAALSIVAYAREAAGTVRRTQLAEVELRRASAFIDAVALWPREDLDRHLGERREGPWTLTILRPTPLLYSVRLTDSTNAHVFLTTALFRRDVDSGQERPYGY
jgi:type II secretory pathway pseudopilin PulG